MSSDSLTSAQAHKDCMISQEVCFSQSCVSGNFAAPFIRVFPKMDVPDKLLSKMVIIRYFYWFLGYHRSWVAPFGSGAAKTCQLTCRLQVHFILSHPLALSPAIHHWRLMTSQDIRLDPCKVYHVHYESPVVMLSSTSKFWCVSRCTLISVQVLLQKTGGQSNTFLFQSSHKHLA